MGNSVNRPDINALVESYTDYDENSINRGTTIQPKPLLKFHTIHGTNVELLDNGKIARRRSSFCKGLAFSNRPISVEEIVCIRLYEVGKSWSGVLRIGVTNVDPASFRDIELPKFACPDLISKSGYWAKALGKFFMLLQIKNLAERYSIEKAILHFYVNSSGEMYYGINGENKGLFLNGINVELPIWIIVDIYGNSVGVEFVSDFNILNRICSNNSLPSAPLPDTVETITTTSDMIQDNSVNSMSASTSGNNLTTTVLPQNSNNLLPPTEVRATSIPSRNHSNRNRMRFHVVKGVNIILQADDLIATRKHGEYYLGYVFTERPINILEKISIVILQTEEAFTGSLAFGLTSCDPIEIPASRLPIDSDELLERPEYWVTIKDVGATSLLGDKLSFYIDNSGQVFFSKNDAPFRVIMHVDISVKLWVFFDLYGKTRKIQLLDETFEAQENERNRRAASEGSNQLDTNITSQASTNIIKTTTSTRPSSVYNLEALRVALPPPTTINESISTTRTSTDLTTTTPLDNSVNSSTARANFNILPIPSAASSYLSSLTEEFLNRYRTPITTTTTSSSCLTTRPRAYERVATINGGYFNGESYSNNQSSTSNLDRYFEYSNGGYPSPSRQHKLRNSTIDSKQQTTTSKNPFESTSTTIIKTTSNDETKSFTSECTICMNNQVNSVIYRCGHMCMCFSCAKEMQNRSGDCPICRTAIIDVIRCFPSF